MAIAAGSPSQIILAGRSLTKIQPVIDRINAVNPGVETILVPLDLSSLDSVREAAGKINESVDKLDILINNAGIMACPFAKTVDGIESQFGTNYIGHFLLTNLILPKILAAGPGSRIVNVSSSAHRMSDIRLKDWNFEVRLSYAAAFCRLTYSRMERRTMRSELMEQPKQQLFYSLSLWQTS